MEIARAFGIVTTGLHEAAEGAGVAGSAALGDAFRHVMEAAHLWFIRDAAMAGEPVRDGHLAALALALGASDRTGSSEARLECTAALAALLTGPVEGEADAGQSPAEELAWFIADRVVWAAMGHRMHAVDWEAAALSLPSDRLLAA